MNIDSMIRIGAKVSGQRDVERLGNSMQGVQGKVKNLGLAVGGLSTALKGLGAVLAIGGLTAFVKGGLDLSDAMGKASTRTGVAAEELLAFQNAAKLADVDQKQLINGLAKLNINMVSAAEGNQELNKRFQQLGIEVKNTDGSIRDTSEVFKELADRFKDMPNGAQKAAAAMTLFGKSGVQLITLLSGGSESLEEFGVKLGPNFAQRAEYFNDSVTKMGFRAQAFQLTLMDALLPALQGIVNGLTLLLDAAANVVVGIGKMTAEFIKGIGGMDAIRQAAANLIKTMVVLGGVTAGVFLATNLVTFANALRGVVGVMRTMLTLEKAMLAVESARLAIAGLIAGVKAGKTPVTAAVGGLLGGGAATAALFAGLSKLIDDITKRITTGLEGAMKPMELPTVGGAGFELRDLAAERQAASAGKVTEITREQALLNAQIRDAKESGNQVLLASLEYQKKLLEIDNARLGPIAKQDQELEAASELLQKQIGFAKDLGSQIAKSFMENQTLQENYNRTVEDLKIKTGEISGEELKQINIKREMAAIMERLPNLTEKQIAVLQELVTKTQETGKSFKEAFQDKIDEYKESLADFGGQAAGIVINAFQGMEDALTEFVMTGKANFRDLANSIIADITRIAIRQAIIKPLVGALFPGITNANGNVFAQNGIVPFAKGGIVDRPMVFPFAKGIGLMGEAGPEAIMPLKRGPGGRLGVEASGGVGNIVVNVDAQGTQVEGDQPNANKLGEALGAAVRAELIRQKRPGGLLS